MDQTFKATKSNFLLDSDRQEVILELSIPPAETVKIRFSNQDFLKLAIKIAAHVQKYPELIEWARQEVKKENS